MVTAVLAVLLVAACGGGGGTAEPTASAGAGAGAFPVTVGALTLPRRPEKVVVLAPSATEMLFAIGAGKQVVAVDDNSNYPADAPKTALSGFQPNAEAIMGYQPDLVVISDDLNNIVAQLGALKVPVFRTGPAKTLDDTYTQLGDLGRLTGHPTEAADTVARMKADIDKLLANRPKRPEKPRYYYELDQSFYSATSKTFIGSLFDRVGLANVADAADPNGVNAGYPQLSGEFLIKADPQLIFLADTKCCGQNAETVKARPGWSAITAVREGRVEALDDDIASRWGPRVVDLVRAVVAAVDGTR